jgi:hypothetical protein
MRIMAGVERSSAAAGSSDKKSQRLDPNRRSDQLRQLGWIAGGSDAAGIHTVM